MYSNESSFFYVWNERTDIQNAEVLKDESKDYIGVQRMQAEKL